MNLNIDVYKERVISFFGAMGILMQGTTRKSSQSNNTP